MAINRDISGIAQVLKKIAFSGVSATIYATERPLAILSDMEHGEEGATTIYCDKMSVVAMSKMKNPIFKSKTKHIELRRHFRHGT